MLRRPPFHVVPCFPWTPSAAPFLCRPYVHPRWLGTHGRWLGTYGRWLGTHGRWLGTHGRWLGTYGRWLGTYGRWLGTYGRWLGTYGRWLGTYGRWLGTYGRWLGTYGRWLGRWGHLVAPPSSLRWRKSAHGYAESDCAAFQAGHKIWQRWRRRAGWRGCSGACSPTPRGARACCRSG